MGEQSYSEQETVRRDLLLGGLKGDFANSFCVMQTGIEALESYLAQNAQPQVCSQAEALLHGVHERMAYLERLSDNVSEALLGRCGELHPVRRPLAITTEASRACHFVQREIEARGWCAGVEWKNELDEPFFANADPAFVDGIFANLFSNALRHTGGEPRIVASAARIGGMACITISDRGGGIARPILNAVLAQPPELLFSKGASPQNLGLYLTACYCRALGWKLRVESGETGTAVVLGVPELSLRERALAAASSDQMPEKMCAMRQNARLRREFDGVFGKI